MVWTFSRENGIMLTGCPVQKKRYLEDFKGNSSVNVVRQLSFERTNGLLTSWPFAFNVFYSRNSEQIFWYFPVIILRKVLDLCASKHFPVVLVLSKSPLLWFFFHSVIFYIMTRNILYLNILGYTVISYKIMQWVEFMNSHGICLKWAYT